MICLLSVQGPQAVVYVQYLSPATDRRYVIQSLEGWLESYAEYHSAGDGLQRMLAKLTQAVVDTTGGIPGRDLVDGCCPAYPVLVIRSNAGETVCAGNPHR